MLKLSQIKKSYTVGDNTVEALRGVDLEFRENEFVSILGPSGCGKTTTLNIIGGLDRYTSSSTAAPPRSTATATGTPTATTPWALCSKAITSSPTRRCWPMWSWP